MVIRIKDLVPGANTSEQGACVFDVLKNALDNSSSIVVSFDGVQTATSSFVSSAFVALLDHFSYADIKARSARDRLDAPNQRYDQDALRTIHKSSSLRAKTSRGKRRRSGQTRQLVLHPSIEPVIRGPVS